MSPEAPVAVLLHDQQMLLEPDKSIVFTEGAIRIQKPEGLAAGNLAFSWQPATDTVTVNKLEIRRGGQIIDVLASGQTFTILRRETNLEAATLDGALTATIQPEGLQEGDVVVVATTVEHADPVTKGHAEATFAEWNGVQIAQASARILWPSTMKIGVRSSGGLPRLVAKNENGRSVVELSLSKVEPLLMPRDAPVRFKVGRLAEASDFSTWASVSDLMTPLYRRAAVLPATGPLRTEVETLRKSSKDPKILAARALQIVQERIRYVALLMGQGSYVPATPEQTWSRRYGDCKAKTTLLLAMLHELGIEADAVLVNATMGGAIPDRLPMLGVFNHVLVRAHIGGKTYWLDGTRTGDSDLDSIRVPDFGWGLPLIASAELVRMTPAPLTVPESESLVVVQAERGIYAPARVSIEEIYRGDNAQVLSSLYAQATKAQRDEAMLAMANKQFDKFTVASSDIRFDKPTRTLRMTIKGEATLAPDNGWLHLPYTGLAYEPDFNRPAGPFRDVPVAISFPEYSKKRLTIHLPRGFAAGQELPKPVKEVAVGVEYGRSVSLNGNVLVIETTERSIVPEVPYVEALAAQGRVKALSDDDVYLRVPNDYRASKNDLTAKRAEKPESARAFVERGNIFLWDYAYDEAIADFTEALRRDPKNAKALASRSIAYASKRNFEAAEKDLKAAEDLGQNDKITSGTRAYLAEIKGDFTLALKLYSTVLENDPKDMFARYHRAMVQLEQGKHDEALRDMDVLVAQDPKDIRLLIQRAAAKMRIRRFDEAKKDIDAAAAIDPKHPMVQSSRGAFANMRRDFQAAVEASTKAIEADPTDLPAVAARANFHYRSKDYDKALADTETLLKAGFEAEHVRLLRANIFQAMDKPEATRGEAELISKEFPESVFAQVAAGKIFARVGRTDAAMKAFDRAIAIKPEAYIYVNRSEVRPWSDVAGRLADLDAALKLDPADLTALYAKAELRLRSGDNAGALETLDKLRALTGERFQMRAQYAVALHRTGKTAEARSMLDEQRRKAVTPDEFNNLCWAQATASINLEAALGDCLQGIKADPDHLGLLDSLGFAYLRLGRLDEAIAAYDKAIATEQAPSESWMGRAIAHARKGNKERSAADRARALKYDSNVEQEFAGYGLRI